MLLTANAMPRRVYACAALLLLCMGTYAQKLVEGRCKTPSGMLYYDAKLAEDKQPRIYRYTICPDSAYCLGLDFNLIQAADTHDFIRVYEGHLAEGKPIASLGGHSKSMYLQSQGGCITFEFERVGAGIQSVWTALWKVPGQAACINPQRSQPDAWVQDVCGPSYHVGMPRKGPQIPLEKNEAADCVHPTRNPSYYRFQMAQSGTLNFSIRPDNGYDDLDWVLWRVDHPDSITDPASLDAFGTRVICNFSGGRSAKGMTGLSSLGEFWRANVQSSPWSTAIGANQGDIFYLLVDDPSGNRGGYEIAFDEQVLKCNNGKPDCINLGQLSLSPPEDRSQSAFLSYSSVMRLDMNAKMNQPIRDCPVEEAAYHACRKQGKAFLVLENKPQVQGLAQALVFGLRAGLLRAYSPGLHPQPLHYGDLIAMLMDTGKCDSSALASGIKPWDLCKTQALDPLYEVLELLIDERFDRNTGQKHSHIRYIRLLWVDFIEESPDFNALLFRYDEVKPLLEAIEVPSPLNDARSLSLADVLETHLYEAVPVKIGGQHARTIQQASFKQMQQLELENYIWSE